MTDKETIDHDNVDQDALTSDDPLRVERRLADGVYRILHGEALVGEENWAILALKGGGYRLMTELHLDWPKTHQQRDELDDFVKEFEKLGEPDIEEGPAVVEEISAALDEYREFLTELVDELGKADDFMEGMSAGEDVELPEGVRVRLE